MFTRFAFATALLVGSVGIATAGPGITDKHYWPTEVGPGFYRQGPFAQQTQGPFAQQIQPVRPAAPAKTCTYVGGARSTPLQKICR
jgi:hypothetical protein